MAVFLDAAGTLIHPTAPIGDSYSEIAARHGIHASAEALNQAFRNAWVATSPPIHPEGHPPADDDRSWWKDLVNATFAEALATPLEDNLLEPLFQDLYQHFAEPDAWGVFPEVTEALDAMASAEPLWVLSNFDGRLRAILEGHELAGYFEGIIVSSEVGASKPHPRMFEAALKASGASASECYHIGDDPACDHEGACAAGMHAFPLERPGTTLLDAAKWLEQIKAKV